MRLNGAPLVILFVSFIILGVFLIGIENIVPFVTDWEEKISIVTFLKGDLGPKEIEGLYDRIIVQYGVKEIIYTSKEEALNRFLKEEAVEKEVALLGDNPLPASFLIKTEKNIGVIKEVSKRIAAYPEVDEVNYGGKEAEELLGAILFFRMSAFIMGGILSLGLLIIVSNAFRLSLFRKRDHIIKKFGEEKKNIWAIRGGFLGQAILKGLVASLFSLGILYGIYRSLILTGQNISFMNLEMALGLLTAGAIFGLIGSLVSWGKIR